ncbi:MAG: hypothetical protein OEU86_09935 [Gammaproteobacteria bacterium]|nr:hypothetical protein [Gammaproteobacteria bacterium]
MSDSIQYIPYKKVGSRPNAIVDGPPLASTILTLSHWPNNQTPDTLQRDTSTATVFAYHDKPEFHQAVDIVSNNHFDQDGLFSMFALCFPDSAMPYRDLLEAAALVGDFGMVGSDDAARLSFIIEAYGDPHTSPLPADTFAGCEDRQTAEAYQSMLPLMPGFLKDIGRYESCWREQMAHLDFSREQIASGSVVIEEHPEHDLAIVRIPDELPEHTVHRYISSEQAAIHPFAINTVTPCSRILRMYRGGYDFHYRYESWLRFLSRRPLLRVALEGLASQFNDIEEAPGTWRADDVNEVIPRLYLDGSVRSSIAEDLFLDTLKAYLVAQPVAWDPWDWQGA